jgi:hypothetical protein
MQEVLCTSITEKDYMKLVMMMFGKLMTGKKFIMVNMYENRNHYAKV